MKAVLGKNNNESVLREGCVKQVEFEPGVKWGSNGLTYGSVKTYLKAFLMRPTREVGSVGSTV